MHNVHTSPLDLRRAAAAFSLLGRLGLLSLGARKPLIRRVPFESCAALVVSPPLAGRCAPLPAACAMPPKPLSKLSKQPGAAPDSVMDCGCFGGGSSSSKRKAKARAPPVTMRKKSKGPVSDSTAVRMVRAVSSMFVFKNPAAEKAAREADAGVAVNPAAAAMAAAAASGR